MRFRPWLLNSVALVLLAAPSVIVAQPAVAQTNSKDATDNVEAVVVTGTLVSRSGFEQPTPTVSVGTDFIDKSAAANITDALNQLPQLRSTLTPSTGTATTASAGKNIVDLRGMGAQRTLVLVDGKRFVSGILEGPVDINSIPQALISGVDIVTGGASAAYGSDAVTGVVNIRLQNNLDGFKGTLQGGASGYGDYVNYFGSLAYGTPFAGGKGQFTVSGEYGANTGVTSIKSRPWSAAHPGQVTNPAYTSTNGQPAQLLVASGAAFSNSFYGGVISSGPLKGVAFAPGGTTFPFNYGTLTTSTTQVGGDGAYIQNNLYLSSPTKRAVLYSHLGYEFSDAFHLYVEGSYADTYAKIVSNTRNDQTTIQNTNAFLPASIKTAMATNAITSFTLGRFSNDYGSIVSPSYSHTWRTVVGANGDLGDGWSYDAYYTHGDTTSRQIGQGIRINANYTNAVASIIDPVTGVAECSSATARAAGCVPINLFGDGSPSPQAVAYITNPDSWKQARLQQDVASFTLRGTPFSNWAGPISVAGGADFRQDKVDFTINALAAANALATGNARPWSGTEDVLEAFAEGVVPLLNNATVAKALDLDIAGRVTNYSTSGTVATWKVGLNWDVSDIVRFRGTVSRDIKAPSLNDLFATGFNQFNNITDPQLNSNYQTVTVTQGTRNLRPEQATTETIGIVLSDIVPGLRASVDYYDINIEGALATLAVQDIVNRCATTNPALCSLITRGTNGQIATVSISPQNLQTVRENGLDIELEYSFPLLDGTFTIHPTVNYVGLLSNSDAGGKTSLAGSIYTPFTVGANGVPHLRALVDLDYAIDKFNIFGDVRYIDAANINNAFNSTNLNILTVPSVTYLDGGLSYKIIETADQNLQAYFRVTNVLNQTPPLSNGSFYTEPTVYDLIGRTFTAGFRFGL